MEQFLIFCLCLYGSLLAVTFIYNCINGVRLKSLNIDKRKKLLAKSEALLELSCKKIEWLKSNKEDEKFETVVTEIEADQVEIEKVHKELDELASTDEKILSKIDDYNKSIDLFLTILTFGIYRKEEL